MGGAGHPGHEGDERSTFKIAAVIVNGQVKEKLNIPPSQRRHQ
jgi:hypothetical protein